MERWALYNNEECEIRKFANLLTPNCDIARDKTSGDLTMRVNEVNVRFRPNSNKLIFQGEKRHLLVIKKQFTSFIENEQLKRGEKKDSALKTRRR